MTGNLLLTFLLVISSLLFADAHGQSDSLKAHSKAEELEQTGRDFFSKGDFDFREFILKYADYDEEKQNYKIKD